MHTTQTPTQYSFPGNEFESQANVAINKWFAENNQFRSTNENKQHVFFKQTIFQFLCRLFRSKCYFDIMSGFIFQYNTIKHFFLKPSSILMRIENILRIGYSLKMKPSKVNSINMWQI
jgi:hypothetical protein